TPAGDFRGRAATRPADLLTFRDAAGDGAIDVQNRLPPREGNKRSAKGSSPPDASAENALAELESLASDKNRDGMERFSIHTSPAFGVSMKTLAPLARKYRRDHQLAAGLWKSGWHEARLLAVLIDDPSEVTPAQMDAWAADIDSWDLCDQACMKLFVKTPFVEEKIALWAADEREFVRRAGFALLAAYAVHGKSTPDGTYVRLLELVEKHASDGRNFVRKAVNWALRQIGKRSPALHQAALQLAERLAASDD